MENCKFKPYFAWHIWGVWIFYTWLLIIAWFSIWVSIWTRLHYNREKWPQTTIISSLWWVRIYLEVCGKPKMGTTIYRGFHVTLCWFNQYNAPQVLYFPASSNPWLSLTWSFHFWSSLWDNHWRPPWCQFGATLISLESLWHLLSNATEFEWFGTRSRKLWHREVGCLDWFPQNIQSSNHFLVAIPDKPEMPLMNRDNQVVYKLA